jgi:hypothetical protein
LKLKVSYKENHAIYPMAKWKYEVDRRQLIQIIPIVKEVRFNIAGTSKEFATFQIPAHNYEPTFSVGEALFLDGKKMFVVNIEPVVPNSQAAGFVYYLENTMPVLPEFWEIEVELA